ncbi:YsnF/AvaK domain-containing protein [Gloeobacter morelensis]|uniref:YsnF/AvaK domain-containing protein n=1 Tax=Gloeobacter morelensis MG652769 TaxID=2781736 RepID=A0ABY3PMX0_9CYAN|nr:YsnF/AvaK domain-containing protein [Gloeobacter morelensis]UFP94954.1 YsnF/AvaK domain-containing protein [Gloeobacter morelensis MG652769]
MSSSQESEAAKSHGDLQLPSPEAPNQQLVVGLFERRVAAEQAVRDLQAAGFAEAQLLESSVRSGALSVTVRSSGRAPEALTILARNGADTGLRAVLQPPATAAGEVPALKTNPPKTERLKLLTEQAAIRKERRSLGEITVRKEMITELKTIEVPLTREELVVERRPASAMAGSGAGEPVEEVARIVLSEEQASYQTRQVLRAEVSIEWHTTIEKRRVEVTLQREALRFDVEGKVRAATVDISGSGAVDSAAGSQAAAD